MHQSIWIGILSSCVLLFVLFDITTELAITVTVILGTVIFYAFISPRIINFNAGRGRSPWFSNNRFVNDGQSFVLVVLAYVAPIALDAMLLSNWFRELLVAGYDELPNTGSFIVRFFAMWFPALAGLALDPKFRSLQEPEPPISPMRRKRLDALVPTRLDSNPKAALRQFGQVALHGRARPT